MMAAARIIPLDCIDDPRLAVFADLRHGDADPEGDFFVAEGRLLVDRLIASDYPVESILAERNRADSYGEQIPGHIPILSLPQNRMVELVGFNFHRGFMACGRRIPAKPFECFLADVSQQPVSLALLGINDPENLGNILRTAAAFGIHRVLLGPRTLDPFSRRVLRVSMGTVLKHHFFTLDDPVKQLSLLHEQKGVRTIASTLRSDARPIDQFKRDDRPMVLLVGNESEGIDLEVQHAASDSITIPMRLNVDSLNVSIATAILIYELTRSLQIK